MYKVTTLLYGISGPIEFEWDDSKDEKNFKKHGIRFAEASTVWRDTSSFEFYDDMSSEVESRFIRIGYSNKTRILLVVFCDRNDTSVIRVISARKATNREINIYEKRV